MTARVLILIILCIVVVHGASPASKHSDENGQSSAPVKKGTSKPSTASHAKPALSHRQSSGKTSTASNLRMETLRNPPEFQQTSSKMPSHMPSYSASQVSSKSVIHPSRVVSSPAVASNAQQYRNSRAANAQLAVSGGPPAATRGTAALSGTNMKRRP